MPELEPICFLAVFRLLDEMTQNRHKNEQNCAVHSAVERVARRRFWD